MDNKIEVYLAADGTVDIYIDDKPVANITMDEARKLITTLVRAVSS